MAGGVNHTALGAHNPGALIRRRPSSDTFLPFPTAFSWSLSSGGHRTDRVTAGILQTFHIYPLLPARVAVEGHGLHPANINHGRTRVEEAQAISREAVQR